MSNDTHISQPLVPGGAQRGYNMLASAPGPLVRAGDFLQLNATTTDATGTLALNGRLLTLDGQVVPFSLSLTFSGTGNQTSTTVPLAHGWIIGFDVFVSSGTITDGEVVASVEVVQGSGSGLTRVMCLASGEVTNIRGLGLAAYTVRGPAATTETITPTIAAVTSPAAGAEFSQTITATQTWNPRSISATLTTAAGGAAREVTFMLDDGTNVVHQITSAYSHAASTAVRYSFAVVGSRNNGSAVNAPVLPIPDIRMINPWRFRSNTLNLAAGDQWSGIYIAYHLIA